MSRSATTSRHKCRALDMDGLRSFLRSAHPIKTAAHVAARTGISEGTVANWLHDKSTPTLRHTVPLIDAYGPDVLAAAVPSCGWLDRAVQERRAADLDARIAALETERNDLCA